MALSRLVQRSETPCGSAVNSAVAGTAKTVIAGTWLALVQEHLTAKRAERISNGSAPVMFFIYSVYHPVAAVFGVLFSYWTFERSLTRGELIAEYPVFEM